MRTIVSNHLSNMNAWILKTKNLYISELIYFFTDIIIINYFIFKWIFHKTNIINNAWILLINREEVKNIILIIQNYHYYY